MITREQIDRMRLDRVAALCDCPECSAWNDLFTLALRALDTEADARLVKAVREAIGVLDADRCDRIADDALGGRVYDRDRLGFAQLMRAIAAALRAEVKS